MGLGASKRESGPGICFHLYSFAPTTIIYVSTPWHEPQFPPCVPFLTVIYWVSNFEGSLRGAEMSPEKGDNFGMIPHRPRPPLCPPSPDARSPFCGPYPRVQHCCSLRMPPILPLGIQTVGRVVRPDAFAYGGAVERFGVAVPLYGVRVWMKLGRMPDSDMVFLSFLPAYRGPLPHYSVSFGRSGLGMVTASAGESVAASAVCGVLNRHAIRCRA